MKKKKQTFFFQDYCYKNCNTVFNNKNIILIKYELLFLKEKMFNIYVYTNILFYNIILL